LELRTHGGTNLPHTLSKLLHIEGSIARE